MKPSYAARESNCLSFSNIKTRGNIFFSIFCSFLNSTTYLNLCAGIFESLSHCVFIFQQSMAAVGGSDHGIIPILKFLQRDHTTPNPTLFGVQLHDIGHEFLCNWISSDCARRFFYYHLWHHCYQRSRIKIGDKL